MKPFQNTPVFPASPTNPEYPTDTRYAVTEYKRPWPQTPFDWLALPVGNQGPSTFTAWYIGDETEPSFPTGRAGPSWWHLAHFWELPKNNLPLATSSVGPVGAEDNSVENRCLSYPWTVGLNEGSPVESEVFFRGFLPRGVLWIKSLGGLESSRPAMTGILEGLIVSMTSQSRSVVKNYAYVVMWCIQMSRAFDRSIPFSLYFQWSPYNIDGCIISQYKSTNQLHWNFHFLRCPFSKIHPGPRFVPSPKSAAASSPKGKVKVTSPASPASPWDKKKGSGSDFFVNDLSFLDC